MSVIFGIREENQIIIAGDKRGVTKEGDIISDNWDKVVVVNDHLAFASAGNVAVEKALIIEITKRSDVGTICAEDFCELIDQFYQRASLAGVGMIFSLPFYCIIAGKGRESGSKLISCGLFKSEFIWKEVPMALYPPSKAVHDECVNSFVRNYKLHRKEFVERTVHEVASLSTLVSPSGSKWTYDVRFQKGVLEDFE